MNLVFISSFRYPDGGAVANRHIAIGKGLAEAGNDVRFILLSNQDAARREFIFEKIHFTSIFLKDSLYGNANKIKSAFIYISLVIKGRKEILKIHRKQKIDALILLDNDVWTLVPFQRLAKRKNIKVLHERTEYPFMFIGTGLNDRLNYKLYISYFLPRLDGLYVITDTLKTYFNKMLRDRIPVEIINMVVDPTRFRPDDHTSEQGSRYLAYCGDLNHDKDGVDILIEAFLSSITDGNIPPETRLLLIGDSENKVFRQKLDMIINECPYPENIVITGKIERSKVPDLLSKASALVLARPESIQSEGGFPTKLGEYLATGKPVIITKVGEICYFLKDGYNAFIAKPGDVHSFSEKIKEVFTDYPKALKIGLNGRKLADNEFNYHKQAVKLADFIKSI